MVQRIACLHRLEGSDLQPCRLCLKESCRESLEGLEKKQRKHRLSGSWEASVGFEGKWQEGPC